MVKIHFLFICVLLLKFLFCNSQSQECPFFMSPGEFIFNEMNIKTYKMERLENLLVVGGNPSYLMKWNGTDFQTINSFDFKLFDFKDVFNPRSISLSKNPDILVFSDQYCDNGSVVINYNYMESRQSEFHISSGLSWNDPISRMVITTNGRLSFGVHILRINEHEQYLLVSEQYKDRGVIGIYLLDFENQFLNFLYPKNGRKKNFGLTIDSSNEYVLIGSDIEPEMFKFNESTINFFCLIEIRSPGQCSLSSDKIACGDGYSDTVSVTTFNLHSGEISLSLLFNVQIISDKLEGCGTTFILDDKPYNLSNYKPCISENEEYVLFSFYSRSTVDKEDYGIVVLFSFDTKEILSIFEPKNSSFSVDSKSYFGYSSTMIENIVIGSTNQIQQNSFHIEFSINECSENCKLCVSKDLCTRCSISFYLDKFSNCQQCLENCESCNSADSCSHCKSFFFVNNYSLCQQCLKNCEICDSKDSCSRCETSFLINNLTQCQECGTNNQTCIECDGIHCTKCDELYYLDNNNLCKHCSTIDSNCIKCDKERCFDYDCSIIDINCKYCIRDKCLNCNSLYEFDQNNKCQKKQIDPNHKVEINIDTSHLPEDELDKETTEIIEDLIRDIEGNDIIVSGYEVISGDNGNIIVELVFENENGKKDFEKLIEEQNETWKWEGAFYIMTTAKGFSNTRDILIVMILITFFTNLFQIF